MVIFQLQFYDEHRITTFKADIERRFKKYQIFDMLMIQRLIKSHCLSKTIQTCYQENNYLLIYIGNVKHLIKIVVAV